MYQIRFRLGLHPRPRWGAYSAPPDGFKGPTSKGRGGRGRTGERQGKEGIRIKERGGKGKGEGKGDRDVRESLGGRGKGKGRGGKISSGPGPPPNVFPRTATSNLPEVSRTIVTTVMHILTMLKKVFPFQLTRDTSIFKRLTLR